MNTLSFPIGFGSGWANADQSMKIRQACKTSVTVLDLKRLVLALLLGGPSPLSRT